MDTYQYPRSRELFERASSVIPGGIYGHLGPAEGCFAPVSAYPLFAERAEGAYVWDVDGNRFIDYMCAYGPNILGYNDPTVNAAAAAQMEVGDCTLLPTTKLLDLAELMVDTVAMADWSFFAKNGGDTTNFALMIARAATGRRKVLLHHGGYHGVSAWMQKLGYPGVTEADTANNLYVDFGDIAAVERIVAENKGEIACFMSTPYHHPVFEDNRLPADDYWRKVRELCTREGIVLAIDDVRCGFRLDTAGSDHYFGFEADLMCFCKSLANGWNISSLCGKDFLKDAAASLLYTGSYWLSAVPMAAAYACVTKMREMNVAQVCTDIGTQVTSTFADAAAHNGVDLVVSGHPSMWFMRIAGVDGARDDDFKLHQRFVAECVKRGVFLTNHHNLFINAAISQADISLTGEVANEAFAIVRQHSDEILGKVQA